MKKRHWEDSFCFVCDYWWLLLLIIILIFIAILTSYLWLPLLGVAREDPQVSPTQTAIVQELTPTGEAWLTFNDPELGYSIQYPTSWEVNLPEIKQQDAYIESVVLAEQRGITSQTRDINEKARVLIVSYPKEGGELRIWIVTHWNWLDGQLEENQFNGFRTIFANLIPAESNLLNSILWVERENDILCFWAQTESSVSQNETIIQTMFDRITFIR